MYNIRGCIISRAIPNQGVIPHAMEARPTLLPLQHCSHLPRCQPVELWIHAAYFTLYMK